MDQNKQVGELVNSGLVLQLAFPVLPPNMV